MNLSASTTLLLILQCVQPMRCVSLDSYSKEDKKANVAGLMDVVMLQLQELKSELREEKQLRESLQNELATLKNELAMEKSHRDGEIAFQLQELRSELMEEKQLRESLQNELATLKNELAMEKSHRAGEIAFSVFRTENFGPVSEMTKIPFPGEEVNVGDGWKPDIDSFQAPIAGHYLFFASIRSTGSGPHVLLRHNNTSGDRTIAGLIGSQTEPADGDANSAIVYLDKGDIVSLQLLNTDGGVVYSSARYTTFSGFLLSL